MGPPSTTCGAALCVLSYITLHSLKKVHHASARPHKTLNVSIRTHRRLSHRLRHVHLAVDRAGRGYPPNAYAWARENRPDTMTTLCDVERRNDGRDGTPLRFTCIGEKVTCPACRDSLVDHALTA